MREDRATTVPVLVYDRVLADFVRFVQREPVELPPRPFLLTFADARRDSWAGSDAILRRFRFNAVLFAAIGPVETHRPTS